MSRPDLSRRTLLQGTGVAAGGLALGACAQTEDPYAPTKPPVPGAENWVRGQEKHVTSSCAQCEGGCAIQVRVVEGRAVKIEGHPDFPVNRGGIGPKGQAGLGTLYHPGRILTPLRRSGPKGSGLWTELSWEAAIEEVAARLSELRQSGRPEGLVVIDGESRGPMYELWSRFLEAYGSPNHVDHRATRDGGLSLALEAMQGHADLPAYDWDRVRYVLGFGSSLFESWCQSVHLMRRPTPDRSVAGIGRVKFTQVSPRHSITASKADEWIPIEPATYGALALGIAHVLIRDGLYDEDFVRDQTFGFETWSDGEGRKHKGFRDVAREYSPEVVEGLTGVDARRIARLAHEFSRNRPAVAIADGTATAATNGYGAAMAIHALNALVGNLERPGGVFAPRRAPLAPWPEFEPDEVARRGLAQPRLDGAGGAQCPLGHSRIQELPGAVLDDKPYAAEAVLLYRSNPAYSKPEGQRWAEALRHVPLVVSFSPLHDESTYWADFVLPDHTYLERWELVEPAPSVAVAAIGLRQPVVEPLHATRPTGDVVIGLAKALGEPLAGAFDFLSWRSAGLAKLKGLVGAEGAAHPAESFSALGKVLAKHGGWWEADPTYEDWQSAFRTPSGRFEFFSRTIERRLADAFPVGDGLEQVPEGGGVLARGDALCLPRHEAPRYAGSAEEFPLVLLPYRPIHYAEGGARHLGILRELPGSSRLDGWKEWIELSPRDAKELDVADGEQVLVESPAGSRRLRARVDPGTRPGTAGLPLGLGVWPPDPEAGQTGGWAIVANVSEPLTGILAIEGTRIRVRRIST